MENFRVFSNQYAFSATTCKNCRREENCQFTWSQWKCCHCLERVSFTPTQTAWPISPVWRTFSSSSSLSSSLISSIAVVPHAWDFKSSSYVPGVILGGKEKKKTKNQKTVPSPCVPTRQETEESVSQCQAFFLLAKKDGKKVFAFSFVKLRYHLLSAHLVLPSTEIFCMSMIRSHINYLIYNTPGWIIHE